jgi:hypothetical protein
MTNQEPSNTNYATTFSEEAMKLSPEYKKLFHKMMATTNYIISLCESSDDVELVTEEIKEIMDKIEQVKLGFLQLRSGKLID